MSASTIVGENSNKPLEYLHFLAMRSKRRVNEFFPHRIR